MLGRRQGLFTKDSSPSSLRSSIFLVNTEPNNFSGAVPPAYRHPALPHSPYLTSMVVFTAMHYSLDKAFLKLLKIFGFNFASPPNSYTFLSLQIGIIKHSLGLTPPLDFHTCLCKHVPNGYLYFSS